MKKLMIIAGGPEQITLVKQAKKMGLYVFNTSLEPDSPCFMYADEHEAVDVLNIERHLKIAKSFKPQGIVTDQSDMSVITVAHLCEELRLPGIGSKCARLFTNKYYMREFCKANNIPHPRFRHCETLREAIDFFDKYGAMVIKPLDGRASKGVFTITHADEIEQHFEIARKISRDYSGVIVEEYISGTEYTVEGIKMNDSHVSLVVSEKDHYPQAPNVASFLHFSHCYSDELKVQNDSMINKMELSFGLTHAEYIEHDGKYYLVEVAARGGGVNTSSIIVPFMSGVENSRLLIQMSLGELKLAADCVIKEECLLRECILEFLNFPEGKVRRVIGADELDKIPNVLDYKLPSPGDNIEPLSDDNKRPGHFIIGAADRNELESIRSRVLQTIQVEYV